MVNQWILSILLFALMGFSHQVSPDDVKKSIQEAATDAEKRLNATEPLAPEILEKPRDHLRDIGQTGADTVDKILSFSGPGDKQKAVNDSLEFWKQKMEKIIKPFIDNAEANKKNRSNYDFLGYYKHIDDKTFKRHEAEVRKIFDDGETLMRKEYERLTGEPPRTAEEVPISEWNKMAGKWSLKDLLFKYTFQEYALRDLYDDDSFVQKMEYIKSHTPEHVEKLSKHIQKWKEF